MSCLGSGTTDRRPTSVPGLARQFTPPLGQQLPVTSSDLASLGFMLLRADWHSVYNMSSQLDSRCMRCVEFLTYSNHSEMAFLIYIYIYIYNMFEATSSLIWYHD